MSANELRVSASVFEQRVCDDVPRHRRIFLTVLICGLLGGTAAAQSLPRISVGRLRVELDRLVEFPNSSVLGIPVYMDTPNDGTDRLFFAELQGRIRIKDGENFSTFLDVSSELPPPGGPTGLLGYTFHPGYADPQSPGYRKVYTYHTTLPDAEATPDFTPPSGTVSHHNLLTEWQVDENDPNLIDVNTRREVFREAHTGDIHHGGMLEFGPDGYLYGSIGTPPPFNLRTFAQDLSTIQGKIFKIDPLDPASTSTSSDAVSSNGKYRVPDDNPFVNEAGALPEIFASGIRHVFRFSVDPETNHLFVGDVGQGSREEVNVVFPGDNLGWPYFEGTRDGSNQLPQDPPEFTFPFAEYGHVDGRSVIGGYVYRGSIEALQGKYIFGEFSWGTGPFLVSDGRLLYVDPYDENGDLKDPSEIQIREILKGPGTCVDGPGEACAYNVALYSYAIDDDGELYVLGVNANGRALVEKITDAFFLPEGDYDENGVVDQDDYMMWQESFGEEVRIGIGADGNANGVIDAADYTVWRDHLGQGSLLSSGAAANTPVPEPVSGVMLMLGATMAGLLARPWRRR